MGVWVLSEAVLCLGVVCRRGTARVGVSQGRQPCWKRDHRFGRKDILATVVRTGKCGVYFRVIEEGVAQAGTEMRLVERRYPEWTITRLFHLVIGGGARSDMTAVRELSNLPVLAQSWRERARKLARLS